MVKNGDAVGIYTEDVFYLQIFRNNIFLGGPGGAYNGWSSGPGDVLSLDAADASVSLDYDAYGSTRERSPAASARSSSRASPSSRR